MSADRCLQLYVTTAGSQGNETFSNFLINFVVHFDIIYRPGPVLLLRVRYNVSVSHYLLQQFPNIGQKETRNNILPLKIMDSATEPAGPHYKSMRSIGHHWFLWCYIWHSVNLVFLLL